MNKRHLLNRSAIGQTKGHEVKRKTKQGLVSGIILVGAIALTTFTGTAYADETTTTSINEVVTESNDISSDNEIASEISTDTTNSEELTSAVEEKTVNNSAAESDNNLEASESNSSASADEENTSSQEETETVVDSNTDNTDNSTTTSEEMNAESSTETGSTTGSTIADSTELTSTETSSDTSGSATISIDNGTVTSDSDDVSISDSVITLTKAGTYTIVGSGDSYVITVDSSVTDTVTINLENTTLTNTYISSVGDLNIVVLSDSTISSDLKTAIAAEGVLQISSKNGGTLTVSSSAKHALKAGSIILSDTNLNLTSTTSDGIHATEFVTITNSNVNISAADDGIQIEDETDVNSGDITISDSTVTINSADKGITVTDQATIEGNSVVTITSGDEGIEGRYINLIGGEITIDAGDDGINATEWTSKEDADLTSLTNTTVDIENDVAINIAGASVYVIADGDGLDSNGNLTISSGSVYVTQTSVDNAAIDYDGTGIISGGTVWAIGNQGMAQAFTTGSSQSYIMTNVSGSSGDTITVTNS